MPVFIFHGRGGGSYLLLEDAVAVYKKKWEVATGQDEMVELSPALIEEWMGDALPDHLQHR